MSDLLYEVKDRIATITLNRPDKLNAFTGPMIDAWARALADAQADANVNVIVVTGAGRAFSAGADLKAGFEANLEGHPDVQAALRDRYHPIITGVRTMPKPVIAAVNGPAVGIGCSLALACDLVLAAESAYLMLAFVNIGLVPERVGMARAAEMAMLGERVDARRALDWGLVNRVVADDALADEAAALADRLAAGPARSYAGSKRQLNAWLFARMEAQLDLEASIQQEMAGSPDFQEGVQAFLEKRAPRFSGH